MDKKISLRSLVAEGIAKRLSVDAGIRQGVIEILPESAQLAPFDVAIKDAQERLFTVVQDLANYGTRREYTFVWDEKTERERTELNWLLGRFGPEIREEVHNLARRPAPQSADAEDEFRHRRRSLGECVAHLVRCLSRGTMDFWLLHWLGVDMGYNLDWVFLGVGPMFHMWKDPELAMKLTPPSLSSYDQKTGRIVYEDMTALHDRQTMSLWGFTDWQWLFNLRALVKTVYKSPTIPLLSRLVSGWRIPQQLPQMPCLASWLDWLVIWVGNEFMTRESDCSFAGEDAWKKDVLASVVANRLSGVLLLGLGVQTTSQYKSARTEPTANVLRLAWIVRMMTERRGRDGFLDFLDLVNDEAKARGFANLGEVFAQKTWSLTPRKMRNKAGRKDQDKTKARDLVDRSVPWGVPMEATVSPLELVGLIQAGAVPMDEDEDVTWQPQNAGEHEARG